MYVCTMVQDLRAYAKTNRYMMYVRIQLCMYACMHHFLFTYFKIIIILKMYVCTVVPGVLEEGNITVRVRLRRLT